MSSLTNVPIFGHFFEDTVKLCFFVVRRLCSGHTLKPSELSTGGPEGEASPFVLSFGGTHMVALFHPNAKSCVTFHVCCQGSLKDLV